MMRDLSGDRLDNWMRRVQDDDLPALHSFLTGVKRDHDAVINGLTMSWNSGPVEGAVTRSSSKGWDTAEPTLTSSAVAFSMGHKGRHAQ